MKKLVDVQNVWIDVCSWGIYWDLLLLLLLLLLLF